MTLKNRTMLGFFVLFVTAILSACGNSSSEGAEASNDDSATVSVSGSTSVGPLAEKIAEKYKEKSHVKIIQQKS